MSKANKNNCCAEPSSDSKDEAQEQEVIYLQESSSSNHNDSLVDSEMCNKEICKEEETEEGGPGSLPEHMDSNDSDSKNIENLVHQPGKQKKKFSEHKKDSRKLDPSEDPVSENHQNQSTHGDSPVARNHSSRLTGSSTQDLQPFKLD